MKRIFGLALCMFFTYISHAQLGFRGAVNHSTASFNIADTDVDINAEIGFDVGLLFEIPVNDNLFIQPEVHYVPMATSNSFFTDISGEVIESKITYNYLDVPVLIKFKFLHGSSTQPFVIGGPSIGYALSGKIEEDGVSRDIEFDIAMNEISRLNLGLKLGAGVDLGKLFFDLRYHIGLSDILEPEAQSYKTKSIQLGVGYMF